MSGVAYLMGQGGSNPLNFSVKSYPAAGGLTIPPGKENSIAILTDVAFKKYQLSPSQPRNDVSEGDIWIQTSNSSNITFSVTKKNPILVSLVGCKQYAQGRWISRTTYITRQGQWQLLNDTILRLFVAGTNDYEHWTTYVFSESGSNGVARVSRDELRLECYKRDQYVEVKTTYSVDTSGYKEVVVEVNPDAEGDMKSVTVMVGGTVIGNLTGTVSRLPIRGVYKGEVKLAIDGVRDKYCTIKKVCLE